MDNLIEMHPGRCRPGKSYQGFVAALAKASDRLLAVVCGAFRRSVQAAAAARGCWATAGGRVVFGVDGTKVNCG